MSLAEARADLATALESTGYAVHDHVPDVIDASAPAVIVEPAENYLVRSDTFALDEYEVNVDVWVLVADLDENETTTNDLDDALTEVAAAMPRDWTVTGTTKPMAVEVGEHTVHGCRITATTITNL